MQKDTKYHEREMDEELAGVLTAISVVSKRLAKKLIMLNRQEEHSRKVTL